MYRCERCHGMSILQCRFKATRNPRLHGAATNQHARDYSEQERSSSAGYATRLHWPFTASIPWQLPSASSTVTPKALLLSWMPITSRPWHNAYPIMYWTSGEWRPVSPQRFHFEPAVILFGNFYCTWGDSLWQITYILHISGDSRIRIILCGLKSTALTVI